MKKILDKGQNIVILTISILEERNKMINAELKIPTEYDDINEVKHFLAQKQDLLEQDFNDFYEYCNGILISSEEMIKTTLNTDVILLGHDLQNCLTYSYTVGQCVADANTYNTIFEVFHYVPKTTKFSETDRKTLIEIKTIDQKNLLAKLKRMEEKLDKKITIGQSILKAETQRIMKEDIN